MKVTLEAKLEGGTTLDVSAEIEMFSDLTKLAKKLTGHVAGVRKLLPDMAMKKVERLRIATE